MILSWLSPQKSHRIVLTHPVSIEFIQNVVTYITLGPKPNNTIINVLLHRKAYYSVIIYCYFC